MDNIPEIIDICIKIKKSEFIVTNKKKSNCKITFPLEELILQHINYFNLYVCVDNVLDYCQNVNCKNLHFRLNIPKFPKNVYYKKLKKNYVKTKISLLNLFCMDNITEIDTNLPLKLLNWNINYNFKKNTQICLDYIRGLCQNKYCIAKHFSNNKIYEEIQNSKYNDSKVFEICKYNFEGFCNKDSECNLFHCKINVPSECIKFLKYGYCDDKDCKRIHTTKTTIKCKFFMNYGFCKQNHECNFNHDNEYIKIKTDVKKYNNNIQTNLKIININYMNNLKAFNNYSKNLKLIYNINIKNTFINIEQNKKPLMINKSLSVPLIIP